LAASRPRRREGGYGANIGPSTRRGQRPALRIGDEVMIESGAIVQWLAGTHPEQGLASPARLSFDQWFVERLKELPAWLRSQAD